MYGRVLGAALICDIARPAPRAVRAPTPAIIGIHGGCWVGGHKRDTSTITVTQWAQQFGFFAMSVDYRLASLAAPPACYQDVQCALRYAHANAEELNIDTSRIFVIGESAGAHLAALCATLGDGAFEKTGGWQEASSSVAGAIAVAGPYELEPDDGVHYVERHQAGTDVDIVFDAYPAPAWRKYWTPRESVDHVWASHDAPHHIDVEVPSEADAVVARKIASPINHVGSGKPPILILASATDVSAPLPNAERMCAAMETAGQDYEFENWPEEGHMQITDRVIARTLRFLQDRFHVLTDEHPTTTRTAASKL